MQRLAEAIALASLKEAEPKAEPESKSESDGDSDPPANHGKMIANVTCAPADPGAPGLSDRGKAGRSTEFGAKLSISVFDGFSFVDRRSWDSYNEGGDLLEQIETYCRRFGCYPESVHVDKIYRTRENRAFCKKHGIRMSGPPLGRRIFRKATLAQAVSAADKKQAAADEAIRNHVEGMFGQAKRRFSLGRIMKKLASTSAAQISLSFLVMNLERALRQLFSSIFLLCHA